MKRWKKTSQGSVAAIAAGLLAGGGLAGCENGAPPAGPEDPSLVRVAITPDVTHREWWDQISECSGLSGSFDRLRFFEVVSPVFLDGQQFPCGAGFVCNGMWESPHDISLAPAYKNSERLVQHEMLHDLLGSVDHPPVFATCNVEWTGGDPRRRPPRDTGF